MRLAAMMPNPVMSQAMSQALENVRELRKSILGAAIPDEHIWFRNLLLGIVNCALLDYESVELGVQKSICLAALGSRNLLELKVIATYVLASEKNVNGGSYLGVRISAVVQGIDGNFYGTTQGGGGDDSLCGGGCGTVFRITLGGTLTTLYNFCSQGGSDCTDGREPIGGLVQATDGNFYGTTLGGGANGEGTVFKISPATPYTLTTLYSFCSQGGSDCTDGADPTATLVQATDGNFYGTTGLGGGDNSFSCDEGRGCGTVFRITPSGTLTTLHSFDYADGYGPTGALVQTPDGNFYGATLSGGTPGYGTVFKISPTLPYTLTTVYNFCSQGGSACTDGRTPFGGLVKATDGRFYWTTNAGGVNIDCFGSACGTVFRITPGGTLTTLHSFDYTDGYGPSAGLVQGTDGKFYGTTYEGGASDDGTVFSLSVGIGPFVETLPAFGKVGTPVHILGTNLTGTTSVTFDGTPATFTVVSKTLVFTNVPAGATTGTVQVVTPGGTLSSNVNFQVLP
jgi:uncharacterized repeat protein (TIGR03803 family)